MLLSGSGLELNFVIAQPKFFLQLVPRDGDAAGLVAGASDINLKSAVWNNLDSF